MYSGTYPLRRGSNHNYSRTPGRRFTENLHFNGHNVPSESSREYWCETCDRDFKTTLLLENHKQQHQKCNIDGCQFVAHPKVITKHIQMQHSSGLYKKIAKLANPEEIQKWREERKKKYPTKENVDKKNAQIKEKINRGEKLGLKSSNFQQRHSKPDLKRTHENTNRNRNQSRHSHNNSQSKPRPRKIPKLVPETKTEVRFKLQPFAGIKDLVDSDIDNESGEDCNLDIDDDEATEVIQGQVAVVDQPVLCGALNSLVNDYGISSDDEPAEILPKKPEPTSRKPEATSRMPEATLIKPEASVENFNKTAHSDKIENNLDSDSGPEEVTTITNTHLVEPNALEEQEPMQAKIKREETKKPQTNTKHKVTRYYKPKVPSTLLQKLLQREIQQERNIVLQCIRYVVTNNFFDKDISKSNE